VGDPLLKLKHYGYQFQRSVHEKLKIKIKTKQKKMMF